MSRRSVLMEALAATPRDLARTLRRVDDEQGHRRSTAGARSIADVVASMGEVEVLCQSRWQQVVTTDNPRLSPLQPAANSDGGEHTIAALLAEFTTRREATIMFLSGLEQRDWGRRLTDAHAGPRRLRDDVQALVTRDNEELILILDLRSTLESKNGALV